MRSAIWLSVRRSNAASCSNISGQRGSWGTNSTSRKLISHSSRIGFVISKPAHEATPGNWLKIASGIQGDDALMPGIHLQIERNPAALRSAGDHRVEQLR